MRGFLSKCAPFACSNNRKVQLFYSLFFANFPLVSFVLHLYLKKSTHTHMIACFCRSVQHLCVYGQDDTFVVRPSVRPSQSNAKRGRLESKVFCFFFALLTFVAFLLVFFIKKTIHRHHSLKVLFDLPLVWCLLILLSILLDFCFFFSRLTFASLRFLF